MPFYLEGSEPSALPASGSAGRLATLQGMGSHSADSTPTPHTPARRTVPGPDPAAEAERRRALRSHKAMVTGLLVVAAVIYLLCEWWITRGNDPGWVGFVRAAAEAGMVGGLADWFAVTALFRHPMGLPIPHTALIPRKKDQLGDSLSSFVGENFLNAELITEKIASADIARRAGEWLQHPQHSQRVCQEMGEISARAIEAVDPADAEALIQRSLIDRLAEPQWGPIAGRVVEQLMNEGKVEPLIDSTLEWVDRKVHESEDLITRLVDQRKPVWAPRFLNSLVGDRIYRELSSWTRDVATNPDHDARHALRRFLWQYSKDLQHDPRTIQQVEGWKREVMDSRPVQQAAGRAWAAASGTLAEAARDPESVLRMKLYDACLDWGSRLAREPELQDTVNARIVKAAAFLADNYAGQITAIISDTVHAWDSEEASEKIELMVGKDLQFIRLNGTIVGALAGLAIYTVTHVIFGA